MDSTTWASQERREFASLLADLDDRQWNAPSLCGNWRIRDVAAHVVAYLDRSRTEFIARLAAHRCQVARLNDADVERFSGCSTERLVTMMGENATPRGVGSGFGGRIALVECLVHQQDIRRPLDLPRTIPAERLRAGLEFARMAPLIRGAWYAHGIRLVATDIDWSAGRGPEVRGAGEALLMAMAGRPSAFQQLSGPGTTVLSRRLSRSWSAGTAHG